MPSCEEEDVLSNLPEGNYFPLQVGARWEYQETYRCFYPDNESVCTWQEPAVTTIEKDTVVDGVTYKKMLDYYGDHKLVRSAGPKYYYRELSYRYEQIKTSDNEFVLVKYPWLSDEVLFLDTNKRVGHSWTQHYKTYWGSDVKITFVVKAIEGERTIAGQRYERIVEIAEQVCYSSNSQIYGYGCSEDCTVSNTNTHVYAQGIGEVYIHFPYPLRYYTDARLSLINYSR